MACVPDLTFNLFFRVAPSNSAPQTSADVCDVHGRDGGVPSTVEVVRYANGGEFNVVTEGGAGTVDQAELAARIRASIVFSHVRLPQAELPWAEAMQ